MRQSKVRATVASTTKSRGFVELVSMYPPTVQTLARQTRGLVLNLFPDLDETVDGSGPYIGYGYGSGYKGLVCTIILSKAGVKLGLAGGASLDDPDGLLEGSGKVHKYIALKNVEDLRRPGVASLLGAAEKRIPKGRK